MPQTNADCVEPLQTTGKQPHAIRNGLICAFVVAACLWAAYPVAEMGFIDDGSYAKTAQVFAQTGHIVYNGGTAPMLGWQGIWGALFIRLFGFSFTVVRLSILPIAIATIALFHAILVRFGVNARNAVLGALTLGLSPLFIPLAATYMTDVPGLFAILLCLYLCQRAVAANSNKTAIAWLCLAAATNVVGGTARQIAWLGALVMVPSAGWLLRKRHGVLLTASLLWVISGVSIFACMRWFARQPYSIPEAILKGSAFDPAHPIFHFCFEFLGAVLCLLLVLLPMLVAWLPTARNLNRAALLRIGLITLLWGLFEWITRWTMPWIGTLINFELGAERTDLRLKVPALFLPTWIQVLISALVLASALTLIEDLWSRKRPLISKADRRDAFWLLGPFSLTYFLLLLPSAYHAAIFDRYLLPMMAITIVCLLKVHSGMDGTNAANFSVIVLAIFALLAIGGTHDCFAFYRARLAANDEIRASGVSRKAIQGGFEYDAWTQIESSGHLNEPQIEVPSGASRPDTHLPSIANDCTFKFASYTPDVHPEFTIIFPKMWCLEPSNYPPVNYRTWLPPYHGTILVQEIPHASN